jgi:hypothetical protein
VREQTVSKQAFEKQRKKPGNLAQTLDRTLEPRVPPGRPGRPKGVGNYEWTSDMDKLLAELWQRYGPAKAKAVMGKRLLEFCPRDQVPRKDSVRSAIERRIRVLGMTTDAETRSNPGLLPEESPEPRISANAGRARQVATGTWTPSQVTVLLGALGGDLTNESVVDRTHHSLNAVHAKLRRLGYTVSELRSIAFTVEELAHMLQVTVGEVQSWRRKGWLQSTRRRITDADLTAFFKNHHGVIDFPKLAPYARTFLMSLGYPAPETSAFHTTVKSILESVTGRKRRSRAPQTAGGDREPGVDPPSSWSPASTARVERKIFRWRELKRGPQRDDEQDGCSRPLSFGAAV